jgi:putative ABC transport system permease protein
MWKATIRGLLARRVRLAVTALAVLLGVSFISATYVLTDTVKRSFDAVFRQTVANVDLVVEGPQPLGDSGDPERIPDSTVTQVRAIPGVARAAGFVIGYAQFVGRDGKSIGGSGPPTFGVSWVDNGPFRLAADGVSRAPTGSHQLVMDEGTAARYGYKVGDTIGVLLQGPAERFRIVGLFGFGDRTDFGAVTFAAFDLPTAQRAFEAAGTLDRVYVQRDPHVSVNELRGRIERALGPGYRVLDAQQAAFQYGKPVRDFLGFFTYALLGFAAIGVIVGAFIIFNTFAILVAQRTRELGLLRAMGATGGQVIASVVLEAMVVGLIASALGLIAGVGLGIGLLSLLRTLGLHLPQTTTMLLPRTIVVSLVVGVLVTIAASVVPALRAARVAPMAAINGISPRVHGALRRRLLLGGAVTSVGAATLAYGLVRADHVNGLIDQAQVVAVGAFAVLVGVVILLAAFAGPLARAIGRPLRALGIAGALARANAMRDPRRTAVTASALVIGLALVGLTATFGASARASVHENTGQGLRADYMIRADGLAGFSTDVAQRVAQVPGLDAVVPVRFANARIGPDVEVVGALDPAQLDKVVALDCASGGAAGLADGGVLLADNVARARGVKTGDTIAVQFPRTFATMKVAGVYRQQNFVGIFGQSVPVIVSPETADVGFGGTPQDTLVLVKAAPGQRAQAKEAIDGALGRDFPNIAVLTRDQFRAEQVSQVNQFLTVLIAILALSEIIAVLGIVNTLALSVFERTRELGLLRIVGMSRPQVRTMVRGESVVIALIGGVVGVALGVLWGWAFTHALQSQGLSVFRIPVAEVVLFLVFSMLAGVLAAVFPARRAAKLDVLDAIATE